MLLQTTKKAARVADIKRLLADTRTLYNPFGVSTITLRPVDFKDDRGQLLKGRKLKKQLRKVARGQLKKQFENEAKAKNAVKSGLKGAAQKVSRWAAEKIIPRMMGYKYEILAARLKDTDFSAASLASNSGLRMLAGDDFTVDAVAYEKGTNTILSYPDHFDVNDYVNQTMIITSKTSIKDYGVKSESISFYALWHEIAHGIGAKEAHCDKIAALMCRRHLADKRVLEFEGDQRAVNRFTLALSVDKETLKPIPDPYGWATVEAFDHVLAMKQKDIDAMTEDEIKQIAAEKVEQPKKALKRVAEVVHAVNMQINNKMVGTLSELFTSCATVASLRHNQPDLFKKFLPEKKQEKILERLLTAAFRLHIGKPAYEDDTMLVTIQRRMKQPPISPNGPKPGLQ